MARPYAFLVWWLWRDGLFHPRALMPRNKETLRQTIFGSTISYQC